MFSVGRVSGVWSGRGRLLRLCGWLLLLPGSGRGGGLYRGGVSGRVGLWDTGGLLQLVGLFGDLSGVLLHLLPHIEQPIREGLQDDVRAEEGLTDSHLSVSLINFLLQDNFVFYF